MADGAVGGTSGPASAYYVHADHLNTPRRITRPSGNKPVWQWESAPFGDTPADQNPSGLGTFVYNLRFPGQVYDAESGTNYNYFRDYDAGTGRYAESDPIGLEGGVNTYAYSGADPLGKADPFGLDNPGQGPYGPYWNMPPIRYNHPSPPFSTDPLTPTVEQQVLCMMRCMSSPEGRPMGLIVTGGSEGPPNHQGPSHPEGRACDFGCTANPGLCAKPDDMIVGCAKECGFSHGKFHGPPHWHLQNGPAPGIPPLYTPRPR
jgi:RHS repeat-associated protein